MSDLDGALLVDVDEPMRVTGQVLWFNDARGYGFVLYNDVQHFVHYSVIRMEGFKTLEEGQLVEFEPCLGSRGAYCANVQVVS